MKKEPLWAPASFTIKAFLRIDGALFSFHRGFGGLEADLGMSAVTERLLIKSKQSS
jgi:hypothetical protein